MLLNNLIFYIYTLICPLLVPLVVSQEESHVYDRFFGSRIVEGRLKLFQTRNVLDICAVTIRDCNENEGRRLDGSCTNLKYPSRGTVLQPFLRLLPPHYGEGNSIRKSRDGSDLPLVRKVRTVMLPDGTFAGRYLTSLTTNILKAFTLDYTKSHEAFVNVGPKLDCCSPENQDNQRCLPIKVPKDDPYLGKSGIRCLNLTRMETFQDFSCASRMLPAERTNYATPLIDLSVVYGASDAQHAPLRKLTGGLLREKKRKGRIFPPTDSVICFNNRYPNENMCFEMGDEFVANGNIAVSLIYLWQYRYHNFLARVLADVNPCWNDYKLFEEARKLNIAINQQIYYYEVMRLLLGQKHLKKSGVIAKNKGYVDDYNDQLQPGALLEYVTATRFFHEIQDGRVMKYDKEKYLSQFDHNTAFYRTGMFDVNQTLEELTQGALKQSAARFNRKIDPRLSEKLFGDNQIAGDISSIDIMRNRDLGLAPYNKYRELCGLRKAKYFSDFIDVIHKDRVQDLSSIYKEPDDVDLSVGIHTELLMDKAHVGPTLHCIMTRQLLHWRRSDRFWYERGNHLNAFTLEQLRQIRRMTLARIICDVADGITHIQPEALKTAFSDNEVISCEKIKKMSFKPWRDEKCDTRINPIPEQNEENDDEVDETDNELPRKPVEDPMDKLFPDGISCPYMQSQN